MLKHVNYLNLSVLIPRQILPGSAVVPRQVPMAIASRGAKHIVEATLEAVGLSKAFSAIITIEDVSRGKPEPELFLTAAQALNVLPEDCIVYEDSKVGFQAAKAAGMRFIDVRPVVKDFAHKTISSNA